MIYMQNMGVAQEISIPLNGEQVGDDLTLALKNTTDKVEYTLECERVDTLSMYVVVSVMCNDMTPGEYEYALLDDGFLISTGLLIITENGEVKEYNKTIEYEQYES